MKIKIVYFASLRERIGRSSEILELSGPLEEFNVREAWQKATGQTSFPDDILVALNQEYTHADAIVNDGDELAFFPPVTGG